MLSEEGDTYNHSPYPFVWENRFQLGMNFEISEHKKYLA